MGTKDPLGSLLKNRGEQNMTNDLGWMIFEKGKKGKTWRNMYPNKRITKKDADRTVKGLQKLFGDKYTYKTQKRKRGGK